MRKTADISIIIVIMGIKYHESLIKSLFFAIFFAIQEKIWQYVYDYEKTLLFFDRISLNNPFCISFYR